MLKVNLIGKIAVFSARSVKRPFRGLSNVYRWNCETVQLFFSTTEKDCFQSHFSGWHFMPNHFKFVHTAMCLCMCRARARTKYVFIKTCTQSEWKSSLAKQWTESHSASVRCYNMVENQSEEKAHSFYSMKKKKKHNVWKYYIWTWQICCCTHTRARGHAQGQGANDQENEEDTHGQLRCLLCVWCCCCFLAWLLVCTNFTLAVSVVHSIKFYIGNSLWRMQSTAENAGRTKRIK